MSQLLKAFRVGSHGHRAVQLTKSAFTKSLSRDCVLQQRMALPPPIWCLSLFAVSTRV